MCSTFSFHFYSDCPVKLLSGLSVRDGGGGHLEQYVMIHIYGIDL